MGINKKSLKLLFAVFIITAATFAAAFGIFGAVKEKTAKADSAETFSFESVDFNAVVNEDKTLDITETLTTVWKDSGKRSLIRDIQRQSQTTRVVDGKKIKGKNYYAKMSDISATLDGGECSWHIIGKNDDFYLSDFFSVEMMKPDGSYFKAGTPYTFVLKYKYDMGDDRVADFDDLTFDIFGYEMNSTDKFSAKITFPEGVELSYDNVSVRSSKADIPVGWKPIEGHESFTVEGNVVRIETLKRVSGLTLQVILPKGTFTGGVTVFWFYWLFIAVAALAVIAIIVLFVKNLPKKPVETVEFYPPDGVSVMKFSAIWHKEARSKDAAALILKWAGMGLLTIEKDGSQNLILRRNRIDEVDDVFEELTYRRAKNDKKYFDNNAEKQYFEVLFSGLGGGRGVFSTKAFKRAVYSEQNRLYQANQKLLDEKGLKNVMVPLGKVRTAISFLGLVPAVSFVIYNCIISSDMVPLFFLIFMAVGTFVGTMFFNAGISPLTAIILIFPVAFFGMPYTMFALTFAVTTYDYIGLLIIAPVIWCVCEFVLPIFVSRRTEKANAIYGRMRGFRRFLLTAELPRIQLLFDENPNYFSDILPWCMIMDISKKVQKRFAALEKINVPAVIRDDIDVVFVTRCISHSNYLGAPHSSGSGGSGGGGGHGGSSGGGGGGGGSRSR